jgi:cyclopropane fatty-acyl-phospholipid synthase-like methyltransferase
MDWLAYWEAFPAQFGEDEFCQQVGRTAAGRVPTPEPELARVVDQMAEGLELAAGDDVLDLCCGNGLLTRRLAARCRRVVGVDFSSAMIDLARAHHPADNATYVRASALELAPELLPDAFVATKACMFESLQYFTPAQLPALLAGLRRVTADRVVVYFSGVLDAERIYSFFNTPERRAAYEEQRRTGREIMGHWWAKADLERAAADAGFAIEVRAQDPALNTAHYRFDVKLVR